MTRTTTTTPSRPTAGRSRRRRRIRFAALGGCAALVLAACGDDGDEAAAVCEPYLGVTAQFNGEPDPATITPLLDAVDENAPEDLAEPLGVMTGAAREVVETGDFASFESPEFAAAQGTVDPWMFEHCEFDQKAEVTASEFKFEGLPSEFDAGTAAILLSNGGAEVHEMAIMRKADGVTQSWEEILALPQEEGEALVVQVGGAFAPNKDAKGLAVVDLVPGDYVATCFVPAGTAMASDGTMIEGTGTPHFMHGMISEFTVEA
jgi:hypothetical protein